MDRGVPAAMRVASLTGLLVPAESIVEFRSRFLRLLPDSEGTSAFETEVHASDLFQNARGFSSLDS